MIERLSGTDCAELALDRGAQPRVVGAIVELAPPSLTAAEVRALLAPVAAASPLLGRRVRRVPLGCGRPVWEPVALDLAVHVRAATCGDDAGALLDLAARAMRIPLPRARPLWRLVVVTRPSGSSALIWVSHHACGDGPALLAELLRVLGPRAGGAEPGGVLGARGELEHRGVLGPGAGSAGSGSVARRPTLGPCGREGGAPVGVTTARLARDALVTRWHAVGRLPAGIRLVRAAARELAAMRTPRAPATPFNARVDAGLRYATCTVSVRALRDGARACGATVNDALLCAAGGALGAALDRLGEPRDELVATVAATFGARRGSGRPRNEVGGMLVPVPADVGHHVSTRLRSVAAATRERKALLSAAVPTVLAPVMRLLAAVGLYGWAIERQRIVNVAVSNLRGPGAPPVLCGRAVSRIAPLATLLGNVPLDVMALSTGDDLVVTLCVGGTLAPSAATLVRDLAADLDAVAALAGNRRGGTLVG